MTDPSPRASWREWRFAQLLVFTVATMLVVGFELKVAALLGQLLILNVVLVSSSMTEKRLKNFRPLLISCWLVNLVLQLGLFAPKGSGFALLANGASAMMLALCVVVILSYVLGSREVSADVLFGSVVAYLFIGIAFAQVYEVVQTIQPGSFGPSDTPYSPQELSYFSMVTIATLGYGDVLPRTQLTQVLAVLEAVVGQFYVAVLVAWLVSAYVRDQGARK